MTDYVARHRALTDERYTEEDLKSTALQAFETGRRVGEKTAVNRRGGLTHSEYWQVYQDVMADLGDLGHREDDE